MSTMVPFLLVLTGPLYPDIPTIVGVWIELSFGTKGWLKLLPWSFLIDYFSNIGDVITASVATRSDVRWTNKSVVISRSYESVANFDLPATKSIYGLRFVSGRGSSVTSKRIRKIVQRRRGVLLGTPSISFNIPGRPAQWANMAALLVVCNNSVHPQRFH